MIAFSTMLAGSIIMAYGYGRKETADNPDERLYYSLVLGIGVAIIVIGIVIAVLT